MTTETHAQDWKEMYEKAARQAAAYQDLLKDIDANMRRAWKDGSLSADAWPVALAQRLIDETKETCGGDAVGHVTQKHDWREDGAERASECGLTECRDKPMCKTCLAQEKIDRGPAAWLFICWKPGKSSVYASVESSGSEGWPWGQWQKVERVALVESGPREQLWPPMA